MKICLECEGISETPQAACPSCGGPLSLTTAVHYPLRRGEADAANPLIGATIDGKYLVQGVLGKGGMGTVYRALHQVSLIPVALKILNPRFSARDEYREYFLAEAQKAGRVSHEHAGRILDVGEAEDSTVYIAMEEVNGVTLHECIHGEVRLAPAVVVDILSQICEALSAAHQAGIVHRDLSPRNVMVVPRGGRPFVKILDFGIAKGLPHDAVGDREHLESDTAPATFANPPYSAPEHLEGHNVDARADLYSLGVIAFEALTQQLPVTGGTTRELAEATLKAELEPLPARPDTPPRLQRLVRDLLARHPDDRPSSADAVLAELTAINQPGSRVLRDVAVLVFLCAVAFCVFAFSRKVDAYLNKRSGKLDVRAAAEELDVVQELRSSELAQLKFEFDGFPASELRAEVDRDGEQLFDALLGAEESGGSLVLNRDASRAYRLFLGNLVRECRDGPVTLTFLVKGRPALGVARLLVDDDRPVLGLVHENGATEDVLNGDSRLRITCDERWGTLRRLELKCSIGDDPPVLRRVLQRAEIDSPFRVVDLLGELQKGAMPVRGLRIALSAEDTAGNLAVPVEKVFDLDCRLPSIVRTDEVSARREGKQRARLTLNLSGRDDLETVRMRRQSEGGDWVAVKGFSFLGESQLVLPLVGPEFEPDEFVVELRDRAGNVQTTRTVIDFYTPSAKLVLEKTDKKVVQPVGDLLFWSGADTEIGFTCSNKFYKPVSVAIAAGRPAVEVALVSARQGAGVIRLRRTAPDKAIGEVFDLAIKFEPRDGSSDNVTERWSVLARSEPMRLDLPNATAFRFLPELQLGQLLTGTSQIGLRQTDEWMLSPRDSRLLEGAVHWAVRGSETLRRELPERLNPKDPYFTDQRPRPGLNVLYLELRDILGRPVDIHLGQEVAKRVDIGTGRGVVPIATFQFQAEMARIQSDALVLEYEQKTRVVFHSDYEFRESDRADLVPQFRGDTFLCEQLVQSPAGGTDLIFELDYARLQFASGEAADSEKLRAGKFEFGIEVVLRTPIGTKKFESVPVRATRSSLRRIGLGDSFAAKGVLADIRMVPVLGPLRTYPDRVPAKIRESQQAGFLRHQTIDVDDLQDCYLAERELTRAQYLAIVEAYAMIPPAQSPQPERIFFPDDPRGAGRLGLRGMSPVTLGGDVARWRADVDKNGSLPVVGIHFYQAYAVARMAGQVLGEAPNLFRLPFGVELERAALGDSPPGILNGVGNARLFESRQVDKVETPRGVIRGLDFGVREWVMDLPWPVTGQKSIVAEWMGKHTRHVEIASAFHKMSGIPGSLKSWFKRIGVIRGVLLRQDSVLVDVRTGKKIRFHDRITSGVPGVLRAVHVPRDGQGALLGRPHRLLAEVGMRLAGGAALVRKVRAK